MITDADIKKLKTIFATKEALQSLDSKVDLGFAEIIKFIGEMKKEIVTEIQMQLHEFRDEMRTSQATLNNHEARISRLEYVSK